jgi:hypothetical protein
MQSGKPTPVALIATLRASYTTVSLHRLGSSGVSLCPELRAVHAGLEAVPLADPGWVDA